jgi:hypothetical protein
VSKHPVSIDLIAENEISIRDEHVLRDEFEEGLSTTLSAKANEKVMIPGARALLVDYPTDTRFEIAPLKQVIRVGPIHRWLSVKGILVHPDSISREEFEAKLVSMNIDVSLDFPWKRSECLFLFQKSFFKMEQPLRASGLAAEPRPVAVRGDRNQRNRDRQVQVRRDIQTSWFYRAGRQGDTRHEPRVPALARDARHGSRNVGRRGPELARSDFRTIERRL